MLRHCNQKNLDVEITIHVSRVNWNLSYWTEQRPVFPYELFRGGVDYFVVFICIQFPFVPLDHMSVMNIFLGINTLPLHRAFHLNHLALPRVWAFLARWISTCSACSKSSRVTDGNGVYSVYPSPLLKGEPRPAPCTHLLMTEISVCYHNDLLISLSPY